METSAISARSGAGLLLRIAAMMAASSRSRCATVVRDTTAGEGTEAAAVEVAAATEAEACEGGEGITALERAGRLRAGRTNTFGSKAAVAPVVDSLCSPRATSAFAGQTMEHKASSSVCRRRAISSGGEPAAGAAVGTGIKSAALSTSSNAVAKADRVAAAAAADPVAAVLDVAGLLGAPTPLPLRVPDAALAIDAAGSETTHATGVSEARKRRERAVRSLEARIWGAGQLRARFLECCVRAPVESAALRRTRLSCFSPSVRASEGTVVLGVTR